MKTVLFENGSEQVVNLHDGNIYIDGAGYQFKVVSMNENEFMTSGKVRKETEEFLTDYFIKQELDSDEKETYINELIQRYVYERDEEWLNEQLEDLKELGMEDEYYNDVSLSEIVSYIYNIFDNDNTRAQIDIKMNEFLGYYSPSILAKVNDDYMLFLQ